MDINKLKEKIKANDIIRMISESLPNKNCYLVGGAIIDILEGRKPKDYDITNFYSFNRLKEKGFIFICETKTAYTYTFNGFMIQFLKTTVENFEYKISQSKYKMDGTSLIIDKLSFENKTLIPTTFTNTKIAKECLFRIPHWQNKGYNIHPMTYLSLLNIALNDTKKSS